MTILVNNEKFELGTNNYGNAISPNGYNFLNSFTKDLFPEWLYEINGIQLKKTIGMVHGENTTLVIYDVVKAPEPFLLELLPLLSGRGYHSMKHANDEINKDASFNNNIFKTKLYEGTPDIFIQVPVVIIKQTPTGFIILTTA